MKRVEALASDRFHDLPMPWQRLKMQQTPLHCGSELSHLFKIH
jgi:hypothetical protein